jgi:hypothetical protein
MLLSILEEQDPAVLTSPMMKRRYSEKCKQMQMQDELRP